MIYVLLIIGLSWNTGNGSAEFVGKAACEHAADQVRALTVTRAAICVPKGSNDDR